MNFFEIILAAVITILFVIGFIAGIHYLFSKFFGIQITTRANYNRAVETNKIAHKYNLNSIQEFDDATISEAMTNLTKKHFAHTSNNIISEIQKIQSKQPAKNDFSPNLTFVNNYKTLGIVYQYGFYCCYYNYATIYIQFTSESDGFLAITQGEPKPLSLKRWFKETNKNVVRFKYSYYAENIIKS